jgi:hypothetical protein
MGVLEKSNEDIIHVKNNIQTATDLKNEKPVFFANNHSPDGSLFL